MLGAYPMTEDGRAKEHRGPIVIQGIQSTSGEPGVDGATPGMRSYGEVAAPLTGRDDSAERVRHICEAAERQTPRALLADPGFQATQFDTSCLSHRMHSR